MPPVEAPAEQEARRQRFLFHKDMIIDANSRATDLGIAALKTSMVINGAAAIALLAFIGQVALRDGSAVRLLAPLKLLVAGVLAGALATGFGYLRMYFESLYYMFDVKKPETGEKWLTAANGSLFIAIALVFASYVIFAIGMFQGADALAALITPKK